jgi:RecA-family ATPase
MPELDDDEPGTLLVGLRTGAWLDAQQFPPLEYHVDRLIPEGFSLMVGAPKIGKSWFALDILVAIAAGGYALGQIPVEQRPVLYLGLEDGDRRLQDRCRTLLDDAPIPPSFHYMTKIIPGQVLDTIEEWLREYGRGSNPLIVVDTLGKVMPPALLGESTYQRDYRIGSALKRLVDSRPGSALLVNHHDRKASSDDFVDAVSGTHGLAGAADTVMVL